MEQVNEMYFEYSTNSENLALWQFSVAVSKSLVGIWIVKVSQINNRFVYYNNNKNENCDFNKIQNKTLASLFFHKFKKMENDLSSMFDCKFILF